MEKLSASARSNRRRSLRRKPRGTIKVEFRKGALGLGPNIAESTLDVSDSGVRLVVTQMVEVMAEVEILIEGYGANRPIKRLGSVRWQVKLENGHFCTGVEFQKSIDYRDWIRLTSPN